MRNALLLLIALSLVTAPAATAQDGLVDQAQVLADHAAGHADHATNDTQGFAENAADPGWQGRQVNWTQGWTCDTAHAASPEARQALEELGACPALGDADAGPDDQQTQEDQPTAAEARELENDTETAARDEVAAAEALVNDTLEDPANATGHLATFLNRTMTILERLVSLPGAALGAVMDAAGAAASLARDVLGTTADAVSGVAATTAGLVKGALGAVAGALVAIGQELGGAAAWLAHAVAHVVVGAGEAGVILLQAGADLAQKGAQAAGDALVSAVDRVRDVWPGPDRASNPAGGPDGTLDRVHRDAGGLLDGLGLETGVAP